MLKNGSVKYGFIGGLVVAVILFSQHFFLQDNVGVFAPLKYLVQLAIIVSIIASIKFTKDKETPAGELLELKTGMKAGGTTTLIVSVFLMLSFISIQMLLTPADIVKKTDADLAAYFAQHPLKDSSETALLATQDSFELYFKKEQYALSKYYLGIVKLIDKDSQLYSQKIGEVNNKMVGQLSSFTVQLSQTWPITFIQIILGLIVSFITTMIFRFKQQSEL
jgi:hypothetical protein